MIIKYHVIHDLEKFSILKQNARLLTLFRFSVFSRKLQHFSKSVFLRKEYELNRDSKFLYLALAISKINRNTWAKLKNNQNLSTQLYLIIKKCHYNINHRDRYE